ncbi:MAG: galactokinase [Bogoriella megaspora]|nr:MAG: galactokinase [Bogoriella megaspora]
MEVPTVSSLDDVYPEAAVENQKSRWQQLLSKFQQTYNRPANFVSRSPGRVNIIGEHIDYSLYEVIPMAITADVLMAVAIHPGNEKPSNVRLANVDPDKFPTRNFEIPTEGEIPIDATAHEWTNYFKAGTRGASILLQEKKGKDYSSVGMDVLVDGTVPAGGGLSSSAAFVCASALAVMKANGEDVVDKTKLTELAIVSERAVGVNSGGMDQSASVFPIRGSALYVSFKPSLTAKNVSIPVTDPELTFVIAQSFVTSDKHVTAPVCYNLRVVECTIAAACLAKIFGLQNPLPKDAGPLGISLKGFHDAYFEEKEGVKDNFKTSVDDLQKQLEQLIELTDNYLPQTNGYSREEIAHILGFSEDEVEKQFLSSFPVRAERFLLRQRALHVFTEALRVLQFMDLLEKPPTGSDGKTDSKSLMKQLGDLMNETQDSCRDVYECSCPEIDELCKLARSAGAVGSRLTGAGWGGCSVHLVPADKVEKVKEVWTRDYYQKRFSGMTPERLEEAIVVSRPGSGSCIYTVKGGGL